ncbi:hypothetical protein A7U60_g3864 [Sanghuangporus baumii]|uniref:Sugar phosphate transporter domain-containing protein n=1 Tax=Sanghuangporus baumii TaxID=108892 RepID=A0A9Q5N6B2_SANBA|nr:hypothetical protein A7U60_g3864 [Sanghuangporus baumii]
MAVQHQQQKQSSPAQVAGVVSFYMTAALVMVFVNKAVLNSSPELPLLFLLIQLLIAVALLHLSSALFSHKIDLPRLELETAKKLAPVVLVNIIGLVFNTLCLRDVEASFFQIARGMQLPLTILVSSISTRQQPTGRVLIAAGTVTIGFLLGVSPSSFSSLSFSLTPAAPSVAQPSDHKAPGLVSLIYGVLSALFIAFHSVLIKSSLPHCNGSTIHLAYWTNLGSALFLFPFVLLTGEFFKVLSLALNKVDASVGGEWNASVFVWGSLVTGVFGFLLCVAGLLSIKVTSPVTHMFSSVSPASSLLWSDSCFFLLGFHLDFSFCEYAFAIRSRTFPSFLFVCLAAWICSLRVGEIDDSMHYNSEAGMPYGYAAQRNYTSDRPPKRHVRNPLLRVPAITITP